MRELTKEEKKKLIVIIMHNCKKHIIWLLVMTALMFSPFSLEPNLSIGVPVVIGMGLALTLAPAILRLDTEIDKKYLEEPYRKSTSFYMTFISVVLFVWVFGYLWHLIKILETNY